jgi:ABC-2 type transport system permease protein
MSDAADGATDEGSALAVLDEALREQFTWYVVAKKEFQDTVRSKGLWVLSLVFLVLFVVPLLGVAFNFLGMGQAVQQLGAQALIRGVYLGLVSALLPLVAMFVGYAALTGERESGSLKVLLSLPFSRLDVLVGKVVGRCAVVALPLLAALGLTALLLVSFGAPLSPVMYGLFTLFTVGFALVMVAIAVSISAAVPSGRWSLLVNFFVYFYFTFVWNSLANGIGNLLGNQLGLGGSLRWHVTMFVKLLSPTQSYKTLLDSILDGGANAERLARLGMFGGNADRATICGDVLRGNFTTVQVQGFGNQTVPQQVCQAGQQSVPVYFSDPAVFVYLLLWIGLAGAVSYYTFARVDL